MILDATTMKVQLVLGGTVTANELTWQATYADRTASPTTVTPGSSNGVSNGTTDVDVVAAPAASTQRIVNEVIIYNKDTASATVTLKIDDNGTDRVVWKGTLAAGDSLFYADWGLRVIDNTGTLK